MKKLGLKPASYKLTVRTSSGRGVYSFCMCPGGYIVDASSESGRIAVNGMSEHARDSARANSAIVCTVEPEEFGSDHPLAGMFFQRQLEEKAFELGGGTIPVQRYIDLKDRFEGRLDHSEPDAYLSGSNLCIKGRWSQADLSGLLPPGLTGDFLEGMEYFDSRGEDLQSAVKGLYPCGEGAGYAGGIMSAAMDGIRAAEAVRKRYKQPKADN